MILTTINHDMNNGQLLFDAKTFLQQYGIGSSLARIVIVEDLYKYRQHATAETIYERVNQQHNNLSKATVYNTLNLLAEKGAIRSINIDGKYTRYDFTKEFHAHFRCNVCGKIEDITITQPPQLRLPDGLTIETENYYISGRCRQCTKNDTNN